MFTIPQAVVSTNNGESGCCPGYLIPSGRYLPKTQGSSAQEPRPLFLLWEPGLGRCPRRHEAGFVRRLASRLVGRGTVTFLGGGHPCQDRCHAVKLAASQILQGKRVATENKSDGE